MERKYTKISRYNPRISFDQYTALLQRKANAINNRAKYRDLVKAWGIGQSVLGTALKRGIKQYDYKVWKETQHERKA